jgi:predicted Fe-Mo cluster-binding NifX family protein
VKLAITSKGPLIGSAFCKDFEQCQYIIIYDTKTKEYASRISPSFYTQNPEDLKKFLKAVFIKNIITGRKINDSFFKIFIPNGENITVEDAILQFRKKEE